MKNFKLKNGLSIPAIGFGTWKLKGRSCFDAVKSAIEYGYTHIDTADVYGNHTEVGRGISDSGINRKDLFLTTKVWRDDLRKDDLISSVNRFLDELKTDYIDLLLVHWPNSDIPIQETLAAMEELKDRQIIKAIGVSNFTIPLLQEAIDTGIEIVNNQVEFHPSLNQKELKTFCDDKNVMLTAYSPIAQGADLKIPVIQLLSVKYGKTPAQIVLNWILKKNIVVIPRSSKPERIKENLEALSFELAEEDSVQIDAVNLHTRIVHPAFAPF